MQYAADASLVLSTVICMVVAMRLWFLARRTRGLPELMWGLAWLLSGITNVLEIVVVSAADTEILYAVYLTSYGLCASVVCLANWQIFHADNRAVKILTLGITAAVMASVVFQGLGQGFDLRASGVLGLNTHAQWVVRAAVTAGLIWGAVMATYHYVMQRRQAEFGLGSPLTAFRFLAWSLSAVAFSLMMVSFFFSSLGLAPAWLTLVAQPLCSLTGALGMWLAFFPPMALRRRLQPEGG